MNIKYSNATLIRVRPLCAVCFSHQLHGSFRAVFIGKKEKKTKKAFFCERINLGRLFGRARGS